jgi:AraC-like DNA-binding protein
VTDSEPVPVGQDSRGILDPVRLQQRVTLSRHPAPAVLVDLVDWFWVVEWDFAPGESFHQDLLTHPGANISVSPEAGGVVEARLYGVSRRLVRRELTGRGCAVAAKTRPGGLGPFLRTSAATYNDRSVLLAEAMDVDSERLVADVQAISAAADKAERLGEELATQLEQAPAERVAAAREVTAVARRAETDRRLRRVDELASMAGIGVRTLQRMFREHAGVSPTWVLRRYRLLDAAELVRDGQSVSWVRVADELGYADQAHLVRDFRAAVGRTPGQYAAAMAAARTNAAAGTDSGAASQPVTR